MKLHHAIASCLLALALAASARACGFLAAVQQRATLREHANDSVFIAVGTITNARAPGAGDDRGSADLVVGSVLKSHPEFDPKKPMPLGRFLKTDQPDQQYIIFFDLFKGRPDAFQGLPATPALLEYLKGLPVAPGKGRTRELRYCFDFLEHADPRVAAEAFLEFNKTTDADLDAAARTLPPEKLRGWLKKRDLSPDQIRMYGFLLGNCGNAADADFLRGVLDREAADKSPKLSDGLITGFILLRPREGWDHARTLLANATRNNFVVRYSAYRACRFLYATRPDVIKRDDILAAMSVTLEQPDFADLTIDDFRQWKQWAFTDSILALHGKKEFQTPIMRNRIVRYALRCPRPEAVDFVAELRRVDPGYVADQEELISGER